MRVLVKGFGVSGDRLVFGISFRPKIGFKLPGGGGGGGRGNPT